MASDSRRKRLLEGYGCWRVSTACSNDANRVAVCDDCTSPTSKQLLLSDILKRNTLKPPVSLLSHIHTLHSPLCRVKWVSDIVVLSFVFILTVWGEPASCLSPRAGGPQHLLRASASLSAERSLGSVQPSPASLPKTAAAPWAFVSPPSPSPALEGRTAILKERTAATYRPQQVLPAFLGAAPISSHDFLTKYKQNDYLSSGGVRGSGVASAAIDSSMGSSTAASAAATPVASTAASSPLAFATTPLNLSPEASIKGPALVAFSPSPSMPSEIVSSGAVTALPATSSSTPTSSQTQSSSSSSVVAPEFDVVIVGLGVGGHAAALHASALGLRTAVVTGGDPGGTCVNRGCVPSKALLAIAKKVKTLRNKKLLASMGIHLQEPRVEIDSTQVAQHAKGVVEKVRGGLVRSLAAHGVTSFEARGTLKGRADRVYLEPASPSPSPACPSSSEARLPEYIRARNVLLAPGSTPFVPHGVELDEVHHRVMTSDSSVLLPWLPSSISIVGAGYIGLEFMDVFSSLGSEVTLVDSGPRVLPGVDAEIAKAAERLLLQQFKQRPVTLHRESLASSVKTVTSPPQQHRGGGSSIDNCSQPPLVEVQLVDVKTKEKTKTLYTDACLIATGRVPNTQNLGLDTLGVTLKRGGFVPVDPCMRVTRLPVEEQTALEAAAGRGEGEGKPQVERKKGEEDVIDGLYCIGDANGQMMLAHAASAQAIAAVETIAGRPRVVNVKHIPAACFTSPEIAFVGDTEEAALKEGEVKGFDVGKSVSHFKANTKAIAEGEAEGLLKVLYRKDNGRILGCHMIGMHASDLIQECATAISNDLTVQQLAFTVHTHPTLSEVVDAAWKKAVGMNAH